MIAVVIERLNHAMYCISYLLSFVPYSWFRSYRVCDTVIGWGRFVGPSGSDVCGTVGTINSTTCVRCHSDLGELSSLTHTVASGYYSLSEISRTIIWIGRNETKLNLDGAI